MRRIAIIGDIHGRTNWQKIDLESYDQVIVMGDYFDPYAPNISYDERLENFEKLITLKENDPQRYILLFGNHDNHYLPNISRDGSRFDGHFKVYYKIGERFEELLKDGTLQAAYSLPHDKIFFTHASISVRWYNIHVLKKSFSEWLEAPVIGIKDPADLLKLEVILNDLAIRKPETFLFQDVKLDNYGYEPDQGPYWWRAFDPYSVDPALQKGNVLGGFTQVSGHTQFRKLVRLTDEKGDVVFVDGLGSNWYTELILEDGKEPEFKQINIE